jgi:nucleoid DNA-binding protein
MKKRITNEDLLAEQEELKQIVKEMCDKVIEYLKSQERIGFGDNDSVDNTKDSIWNKIEKK